MIWTDLIQFVIYISGARARRLFHPRQRRGRVRPASSPSDEQLHKFDLLDFSLDPDAAVHLLGRADRRRVLHDGQPRGRPDDGAALPVQPVAGPGAARPGGQRLRGAGSVLAVSADRRRPVRAAGSRDAGAAGRGRATTQVFGHFIVHFLPTGRGRHPGRRGAGRVDGDAGLVAQQRGRRVRRRLLPAAAPGPLRAALPARLPRA